ncbi:MULTISPECIES: glycine--tRNA ligase subunit beta [unclassified Minwuia]|jgi:glycyl-tRNA synthetase beta chain|uniref:glycine--tRNA ligase subunit beta n=1 Tax=unclassified Minwuia TaxID=2618799 RepID=UPI0024784A6D|nr:MULTISPECIES: glycine--tRNA ligase subunit beta [unclassified Minwuia]
MAELLLELFSEEIPARMQARAADDLKGLLLEALTANGLTHEAAQAHSTPRRLTVVISGIPEAQEDVREERRGPRADAPEKAIEGFLKGAGVSRDQVEERESPKGTFLFAVIERKGQATAEVLPGLVEGAIAKLPWPKSMRWGDRPERWVRPLHSILCLFGGATVPVTFGPVTSGNTTRGHRFHAPDAFEVADFADYQAKLETARVVLDRETRKTMIDSRARALAEAEGLTLKDDPGLLDEVAGLVEWPVPLIGSIDDAFMDVPAEVLTTSMRSHQKYFATEKPDGSLAPRFILVANLEAEDGGTEITAGNEKVLRARLSDARFFWDQDQQRTLESRLPDLNPIVFHARMGSVGAKAGRIAELAAWLAPQVGADPLMTRRAGLLAKSDLTTGMVGEFPELQGIMGRYYARLDQEPEQVAEAIRSHYSPAGPADDCPSDPVAVAVALADKLDSLVGFFAIGEKPTGSKDPFALRRAALGVIRIILENGLRLPLDPALTFAFDGIKGDLLAEVSDAETVSAEIIAFIAERLRVHLRGEGVRHDLIAAVLGLGSEDDLVRLVARVDALTTLVGSDDGANLLAAYRRAANILRIEEKKDGFAWQGPADRDRLVDPAEVDLGVALSTADETADAALLAEDFAVAMSAMAALRGPVDAFFESVTVNADDPALRANRLKLLAEIRATLHRVADFSKIEG